MGSVLVGIPNMAEYFNKQIKDEELVVVEAIETEAKRNSPIKSGNYQNSINTIGTMIIANAIYSAWLEYGTMERNGNTVSFSPPHSTMRKAAIAVARLKGYKYI